jgi:AcrR family transcriptional regulator
MSGIREKQLQRRKLETLDVALRLLMERGYANLNMDELAVEAGISKPTLYQYFNSKDELVAQAVAQMFEKLEEQVSALPEKSPAEKLEHFMRSALKARSEQRFLLGSGDGEVMRSIVKHHPRIRQHMLATKNKLEALVRQAQELGEIDPAFPAWVIVNVMFSLQRVITPAFEKDEPQRSDQELAAAVESIVCLFRRGVGLPQPLTT